MLFTTHDLGTAYEICDRIVVMYAGQEMEAAPTDAFFAPARAPVHAPAAREPAGAGRRAPRHPRRGAEPDRPAARLPLPSALRPRHRGVPRAPGRRSAPSTASTACGATIRIGAGARGARDAPLLEVRDLVAPLSHPQRVRTAHRLAAGGGRRVARRSARGETLGLVGESGCGKSTLGKTVIGISRHRRARSASSAGRSAGLPAARARGGWPRISSMSTRIPGPRLDPRWKVRRSLHEPLRIHTSLAGASGRREVRAILRAVGLPDAHLDLYPHERQRRPAAAGRPRAHPDPEAAHGHPRRADLGARRLRAGRAC